MSDSSVYPEGDQDQDAEPTMTAVPEGRPDGAVQEPDAADPEGAHAADADDQTGTEASPSV
jgi:hypothetical protein